MKIELIGSNTRGTAEHGWLHSNFSFSFSEYYNPDRMGFGLLRVLNDDIIEPGKGFGFHPHNNMEIVSIPLYGSLQHKDSMGNTSTIEPGDVQIMSAGTGVVHSEYNPLPDEKGNFLQIWVLPKQMNIEPRYDQLHYNAEDYPEQLFTVVSPKRSEKSLWINQDAFFVLGKFNSTKTDKYYMQHIGNGAYVFVIEGKVTVNNVTAGKRDALQIQDCSEFTFTAYENTYLLIIEVPLG